MANQNPVGEGSPSFGRERIDTDKGSKGEEGSLDNHGLSSDETPNPNIAGKDSEDLETTAVIPSASNSTSRSTPTTGSSVLEVVANQRSNGPDCASEGRVNFPVRGLCGQIGVYLSNRSRQAVVLSLWLVANAAVFGNMYTYAVEKPEYPIAG
jgi:hypothetical protein